MCSNYQSIKPAQVQRCLGMSLPSFNFTPEVWPGGMARIIVGGAAGAADGWLPAMFGLVPPWATDAKRSRHTYNARGETVASKPSYRGAWQRGQFALVPMASFYEPCYASGRAVRWQIQRQDLAAFTVAALWEVCQPNGANGLTAPLHSFSMLTINADGHPVMGAFHHPTDEKRSLVVVPPQHRKRWLSATSQQALDLLKAVPATEFTSQPAPLPAQLRPLPPAKTRRDGAALGDLFDMPAQG
jgi:putative SOS response-associated peptidase YedK